MFSSSKEIDANQAIQVDKCACSLIVSHRAILEIGLKPAIADIATTIVAPLISTDSFGLYTLSAVIITRDLGIVVSPYYAFHVESLLQENIQKRLEIYQRKLPVLVIEASEQEKNSRTMKVNAEHYIGRGDYSQLSNTSCVIKFLTENLAVQDVITIGAAVHDDLLCRKLKVHHSKQDYSYSGKPYHRYISEEYTILSKGDYLNHTGFCRTFFLPYGRKFFIGKCAPINLLTLFF